MNIYLKIGVIAAVAGAMMSISCQSKVNCSELVGAYTANKGEYRDVIDIRNDGIYVHTYRLDPQGPELTTTNKWTCETRDGESYISFEEFVPGLDFTNRSLDKDIREKPGFWVVEVEKSFGKVMLRPNPDINRFYVKL